jgi:hypothetical protein
MKNVTISMDEELAEWARVEAAKAGQSVSTWIASHLNRLKTVDPGFDADIAAFLATPKACMSDGGRTFDREEIYDRRVFRRFR